MLEFIPHTKRRFSRENPPSSQELKLFFNYDPETGVITRRVSVAQNASAGAVAGSTDAKGYLIIGLHKVQWKAHRMAWAMHYGEWPVGWIDHINGIRSDNRISNLRLVTPRESGANRKSWGPTSPYLGVYLDKKSNVWRAKINLGSFDNEEDAARAYDAVARVVHGEFAKLNFPDAGGNDNA